MRCLHVTVEGQTEETFVNNLIRPHLRDQFGLAVEARLVMTSRSKNRRGGMTTYERTKGDILRWMNQYRGRDHHFTTMFDLYALPADFPGYEQAKRRLNVFERVQFLESSLLQDFQGTWDRSAGPLNLIPYIQLHEFEALLFTDPGKFAGEFIEREGQIEELIEIGAKFDSPEEIDDNPSTAPSKRIIRCIPEYEGRKVSAGPIIAGKIGLEGIRSRCKHFAGWLTRPESLGSALEQD